VQNKSKTILSEGRVFPLQWSDDGKYIYMFDYLKRGVIKFLISNRTVKEFIGIPFKGINGLNNDIDISRDGKLFVQFRN
jgi:hypothetical protein